MPTKHPSLFSLTAFVLAVTCIALPMTAAGEDAVIADNITRLSSAEPCNRCSGYLLPGKTLPHPDTRWGIISDLPESFSDHGVLYATTKVLPASPVNPAPEELRTQVTAHNFSHIDGGFDVFLFHLIKSTTATARIVVYAKNNGDAPVTVKPHQSIKSEGVIGRVHDFESELANRVLGRMRDASVVPEGGTYPEVTFPTEGYSTQARRPKDASTTPAMEIPVGQGRIIAYGKRFGAVKDSGSDGSNNVNCFGYVRARIANKEPVNLDVYVIAIPAGPRDQMQAEAEKLLSTGATSTDMVRMDRPPQDCAVGRAVGVYPNFIWRNDPVTIDIANLPSGDAPTTFPMALPEIQTAGCADARQTTDLVLHPGYTRPDTIGNYMIEHDIAITVTNSSDTTKTADLYFGKQDADVGLAFMSSHAPGKVAPDEYPFRPPASPGDVVVGALWAGPKQSALEKSFLPRPVTIGPGVTRTLGVKFMICGNSSLPFYIGIAGK